MLPFVWFLAGAALAAAHCAALAHSARRYLTGGSIAPAIALHAVRWLVLVPALAGLILTRGAFLPAMAGFALAHTAACVGVGRRP